MRQAERQAGFTLIEVSLAIVIGVIVLAGAVVLYQQTKLNAANTAAKEKLQTLALLVEEMEQRNFALPSMGQLRTVWKTRRPDDFNKSPWGGTFTVSAGTVDQQDFIQGNDAVGSMTEIGTAAGGTAFSSPTPTVLDRGRMYYFRRDPSGSGSRYLWLHELSNISADDAYGLYSYRMNGYGVAMIGPNAEQFYFVAGKGKTNAEGTGRLTAEGSIGD